MAKDVKDLKGTEVQEAPAKETAPTGKEARGEVKTTLKKFYFPEINRTVEAENMDEATKKAKKIK